jgi:hypothetical protein
VSRLAGTAKVGEEAAATVRRAALALCLYTAIIISSTNSGMPSAQLDDFRHHHPTNSYARAGVQKEAEPRQRVRTQFFSREYFLSFFESEQA